MNDTLASGCTANSNPLTGTPTATGETAGLLLGWWHGFILPYSFIASLFRDNTSIYEVHNTGGWYNFS